MHIIALEAFPSSLRGGKELSMFEVCRGLVKRGHQVSLISSKEGNLIDKYQEFCAHVIPTEIEKWVAYPKRVSSLWGPLETALTVSYHLRLPLIRDGLIYVDDYKYGLLPALLAKMGVLPFVIHMRKPPDALHRQHRFAITTANRILAVSNCTRAEWLATGLVPEKTIETVYNGIDVNHFTPTLNLPESRQRWQLKEGIPVITFIGRLDADKGIEVLIKACQLLVNQYNREIQLLIAGNPVVHLTPAAAEQYCQSLYQLVKATGLEPYTRFLGHVTDQVSLYQASDVTVLPSLCTEPFGRTIVESMACGVPVFASNIGGMPEILTGEFCQHLFPPGNEQELASRMNRLLNWRQTDPGLTERCRSHVLQNFSIDRTISRIEDVFEKL